MYINPKKILIVVMIACFMMAIFIGCKKQTNPPKSVGNENKQENAQANIEKNTQDNEQDNTQEITQQNTQQSTKESKKYNVDDILANMTLEQKVAQMLQGAMYHVTESEMKAYDFGSILSNYEGMDNSVNGWKNIVLGFQKAALGGIHEIPYLYGTDAVHGNQAAAGAVIFPHNIGIGAANDEELTYQMGKIVAEEMKLTGMLWNFAPCLAAAKDPRWGRTYESYSSDYELVAKLGSAFVKGQLENGVIPCAKHFIADGNAEYNTGEGNYLIDRGDATLSDDEIKELLNVYQKVIDAGVPTVMVNHGSINGVKLHQHKQLITDELKGRMGFEGFVVSDWESIHNIEGNSLKEKVITAVNAGIDMLMEPQYYLDCYHYIIGAVNEGSITTERIDDAVKRILTVKLNLGIFEDPMQEKLTMNIKELGEDKSRDIARQLVEKSLVLLKNDNNLLPLKQGQKIFVTGPAANDSGVLSGGWTVTWQGKQDSNNKRYVKGSTTILDGLQDIAKEYNLEIITDATKAADADVTILCVGEIPYAEWEGDTSDLSITGSCGLVRNEKAIELAKSLKKPTITLIVAGRNVIISEYLEHWDAVVMCYLPGTEGDGVTNVLVGKVPFVGKLPMPWYQSINDIGTDQYLYPIGYGMEALTSK
ncbi:glycoside hydrolase family 3 protein [Clostridium sp. Marseille-P299]|uniref:glycoside hydrolase family 3 protein n=1 Tax=Clostridium sp. Marseille-P299 TaxID=1805477 RepID=UPI001FA76073|nr:glycoside hydrolase family 3 protein [Clostridium sp. Marseille-P299]